MHPEGHDPARALRSRLRADLLAAMKARQPEAVSALRTALAEIDNAEAVAAPAQDRTLASEHIAGAAAGVGSTEAARRFLSLEELHGLLDAQISERVVEADRYEGLGQLEAAERLRREAEVLRRYLGA